MLTIFVLVIGHNVSQRIKFIKRIEVRDKSRLISESGIYNCIAQIKSENEIDPDLLFSRLISETPTSLGISDGEASCILMDEESKLNINTAQAASIKRLMLKVAKLKNEVAADLANSIVDWRDEDNERPGYEFINNEDLYYELAGFSYSPKNSSFDSIEEILLVKEITPSIYEAIRPHITVYGKGSVNINTCSRVVLESLGLKNKLVEKIFTFRSGVNAKNETCEGIFKSNPSLIEDLDGFVSLEEDERDALDALIKGNRISTESDCFTIVSIGKLPNRDENIRTSCVVDRNGRVKYWKEEFEVAKNALGL